MSKVEIRALASITEEVRRGYIDTMDILHTQDIVTIPLPGLPTGAAGIPPPIRYESESLKILREGGIPLWSLTCGCHEYSGINQPLPGKVQFLFLLFLLFMLHLLFFFNQFFFSVGSLVLEDIKSEENKEKEVDPSFVVEPPASGYSTLERGATTGSPFDVIAT